MLSPQATLKSSVSLLLRNCTNLCSFQCCCQPTGRFLCVRISEAHFASRLEETLHGSQLISYGSMSWREVKLLQPLRDKMIVMKLPTHCAPLEEFARWSKQCSSSTCCPPHAWGLLGRYWFSFRPFLIGSFNKGSPIILHMLQRSLVQM